MSHEAIMDSTSASQTLSKAAGPAVHAPSTTAACTINAHLWIIECDRVPCCATDAIWGLYASNDHSLDAHAPRARDEGAMDPTKRALRTQALGKR